MVSFWVKNQDILEVRNSLKRLFEIKEPDQNKPEIFEFSPELKDKPS